MRTDVVVLAVFLVALPAFSQDVPAPTRVENETAGISIEPPPGWQTATVAQLAENREKIRLSDAELEQAMKKLATPALFAFMKHREPYGDINPSIQVLLRPAPEGLTSATQLLELTADALKSAHEDFRIVEPVHEVTVGGLPGAGMKVSFTLETVEGAEFRVMSRTWAVKRGDFLVLVGMSGAQEGAELAEEEFSAAFDSLRIEP